MCHARNDGCCRIVVDKNTNFDVNVELRHNRTVKRQTNGIMDRRMENGHLCRKVRRSGRYFIKGLMVV